MPIDFDQLRRDVAEATRRAFAAVQSACQGQRLYAFALFSDGSAMTVCPAANTDEAYRRAIQKAEADDAEQKNYYRWAFPEWGVTSKGADGFNAICSALRTADRYDDKTPDGFVRFKARVYATMLLALLDLEREGVFGTGAEREHLTVFCSEPDSGCAVWLEDESARRLRACY